MNRQISIPDGAEQWLINLIELKNRTDISVKQISEKENVAEKQIAQMKKRLITSFIFWIPLMYVSMGSMYGAPLPQWLEGHA